MSKNFELLYNKLKINGYCGQYTDKDEKEDQVGLGWELMFHELGHYIQFTKQLPRYNLDLVSAVASLADYLAYKISTESADDNELWALAIEQKLAELYGLKINEETLYAYVINNENLRVNKTDKTYIKEQVDERLATPECEGYAKQLKGWIDAYVE